MRREVGSWSLGARLILRMAASDRGTDRTNPATQAPCTTHGHGGTALGPGAQGQRLQPIHIGQTTKLHACATPYHEQASVPPVRGRRST